MQYLLLIYENEKRFSQGYPPAEMGEYMAFGKDNAAAIDRRGGILKPTVASLKTAPDGSARRNTN